MSGDIHLTLGRSTPAAHTHTHTQHSVHRPHSPQTHLHHTHRHTHTLTCSTHTSCIHHVILTSLASQGRQRQILQPPDTDRMTTNCINMRQLLHDVMSSSSPRRAGRAGGTRSGRDLLGIPLSQLHPICVNVSQREARRLIPVALTSLFSTRAGLRSTSGPLGEAEGGPSLSRGAALMLFPASRPRVKEFQGGVPPRAPDGRPHGNRMTWNSPGRREALSASRTKFSSLQSTRFENFGREWENLGIHTTLQLGIICCYFFPRFVHQLQDVLAIGILRWRGTNAPPTPQA